ncbi:unnamed protein product [Heligmosomoides polygyrus]|uniref:SCY domain-containing protein n=1 Tax=Heligmosomoides polygyrus TaxID=6339 RepID=A0A183FF20_HELPZ|nr:unnamed protein product [Heligmosomoides polygyrus]
MFSVRFVTRACSSSISVRKLLKENTVDGSWNASGFATVASECVCRNITKFKPCECWYEKIRGTIVEDLIAEDNHHRALCTVPDLRSVVRGRLTRKQEDLEMQQSIA